MTKVASNLSALDPAKLLARLLNDSAEQQAQFNLLAASLLSGVNCAILFLAFPRSTPLDIVLIYNACVAVFTIPGVGLLKRLGQSLARHQAFTTVPYIGIHAWFLFMIKNEATPIQLTIITTLIYGLLIATLLTFPRSDPQLWVLGPVYVLLPTAAVLLPPLTESHIVWLFLLDLGCAYAAYQRHVTSQLTRQLAEQQYLRQKAETEAEEQRVKSALESSQRRENEAAERMLTMAKTAQMLAQDLKQPFTVIDLLLQAIRSEEDQTRIRSLIEKFATDLSYSSAQAKGLIIDLIELGSRSQPEMIVQPFSPLLRTILEDVFGRYPKAEVSLGIALEHKHQLLVDERRIKRAIMILIENALQAMPDQLGQLWVHTHSGSSGQLELAIGNTGRTIPESDLDKVFDGFLSGGDLSGNGLGLAICKKIITAHGGSIRAHTEGPRTWFRLTLPYAPAPVEPLEDFPSHSREIVAMLEKQSPADKAMQRIRFQEDQMERSIVADLKMNQSHIHIAVLDAESFYTEALASQVASFPQLKVYLNLKVFSDTAQLKSYMTQHQVDLLICEAQLDGFAGNGLQLVESLRKEAFTGYICLHSTLAGNDIYQEALQVGAQSYLPKPISRLQILSLVSDALARAHLPKVAVIAASSEDLQPWRTLAKDTQLLFFPSAASFQKWIMQDPGKLKDVTLALIEIGQGFNRKIEFDLAGFVHTRAPQLPILLASDVYLEDAPDFVQLVSKASLPWSQLKRFAG